MDIASQNASFSTDMLTTLFKLLKKMHLISWCIIYFDRGTPIVFFALFPCLYANKPEGCDRGVCVFRNACNAVSHISGHQAFDLLQRKMYFNWSLECMNIIRYSWRLVDVLICGKRRKEFKSRCIEYSCAIYRFHFISKTKSLCLICCLLYDW